MINRKAKPAKTLEAALKAWRMKRGAKILDLSEIFRTDRGLFLDLANSRLSVSETQDKPEIASLSKLARSTLRLTPKPEASLTSKKTRFQKSALERNFREAKSSIAKGEMPKGKVWLFHGIPVKVKTLLKYSPELGPDYKIVVRSLKQGPTTKADLKKKTGVSAEKLGLILKRLSEKQMIRNKTSKTKTRLFFEPHR